MWKKDRYEYFRSRTEIGKLENEAKVIAGDLGHEYILVRDDRHATSFGCTTCNIWGCVESETTGEKIHGSIFAYQCGQAPRVEVGEDGVDILRALANR